MPSGIRKPAKVTTQENLPLPQTACTHPSQTPYIILGGHGTGVQMMLDDFLCYIEPRTGGCPAEFANRPRLQPRKTYRYRKPHARTQAKPLILSWGATELGFR